MYTCIGKRHDSHGQVIKCSNTSDVPTNPDRPEWGFLCAACLGTRYGHQPLQVDLPDADKPNVREMEPCEMPHEPVRGEQDDWDSLQELDV